MSTKSDDELFGQEHVEAYQASGGERGYNWRGTKILLLTTKGSKTGEKRTTPLIHIEDDGRWVIVASKGGAPDHPSWFKNIKSAPGDVEIQVKDEVIPVAASVAEGEEREQLWSQLTVDWPDYDEYAEKTDRTIPVVILTRS